jgi:hypothetical protein
MHSVVGDGDIVDLIVEEIRIRISGTEAIQTPTLTKYKHERLDRAPNSKHRVDVTPAKRVKDTTRHQNEDKSPQQRHDPGSSQGQALSAAPETCVQHRPLLCIHAHAALGIPSH